MTEAESQVCTQVNEAAASNRALTLSSNDTRVLIKMLADLYQAEFDTKAGATVTDK